MAKVQHISLFNQLSKKKTMQEMATPILASH